MARPRPIPAQESPRCPAALPALAALLLAGCALDPAVRAVRGERVNSTAEATEVHLFLELTNPNDAPLELITWNYGVSVDGRSAYEGRWMPSLTLPPHVAIGTELPAVIPASFGDISQAKWRVQGIVDYRATRQLDRLLYQLGITRLHASFEADGAGFAAPKPPPPKPGGAPAAAEAAAKQPPAPKK
jgi:hypothetical protein